jgi:hypothetical protein
MISSRRLPDLCYRSSTPCFLHDLPHRSMWKVVSYLAAVCAIRAKSGGCAAAWRRGSWRALRSMLEARGRYDLQHPPPAPGRVPEGVGHAAHLEDVGGRGPERLLAHQHRSRPRSRRVSSVVACVCGGAASAPAPGVLITETAPPVLQPRSATTPMPPADDLALSRRDPSRALLLPSGAPSTPKVLARSSPCAYRTPTALTLYDDEACEVSSPSVLFTRCVEDVFSEVHLDGVLGSPRSPDPPRESRRPSGAVPGSSSHEPRR